MDDPLTDLANHISASFENEVRSSAVVNGELTIEVRAEHIVKLLTFLRDDRECMFRCLMDICGVDYPGRAKRFDVVYHLLSLTHNQRIRVKLQTDETTPVPSVICVFRSANWFEREAWDMFGIMFADHPDLRRLLTDYGFEGHPLRKDFPLTGFVELRYSESEKRCVYEPVKLTQDFRNFDFMSPWEGAKYILDEDASDEATATADEGKGGQD
jgi:NADH-quinone oxidoreductase subunit C